MSNSFARKRKLTPEEMMALREQSYTYAQIAELSGISRQAVYNLIGKTNVGRVRPITETQCIYPNLRKWMNDNHVSRMELTRRIYGNIPGGRTYRRAMHFLYGKGGNVIINKPFLDKLLEVTGLTYEQLFATN